MSASRDSDDEHSPSTLRHSEEASVDDPPGHAIPDVDQRTEERRHVAPVMAGKKARNVLEEDEGRSVKSGEVQEGEGEAGARGARTGPTIGASVETVAAWPLGSWTRLRWLTPATVARPPSLGAIAEAASSAGDGEILAGEASGPEGGSSPVITQVVSAVWSVGAAAWPPI